MFCPNCGSKNPDGSRFCTGCGQKFDMPSEMESEVSPPGESAAPPVSAQRPNGAELAVDHPDGKTKRIPKITLWCLAGVALAAGLLFVLLSGLFGGKTAEEGEADAPKTEKRVSSSSVGTILQKAKRAHEVGNVDLCGFYVGMDRSDAETLAKHYHLADDEYSFIGDPVWGFGFSLKGIRRLTNGGDTKEELFQSVANRVGNFKKDRDGIYHYRTIDGIHVMMSEMLGIVKMEETTGKTRNRAREKSVSIASPRDVKDLIAGMVRIPGKPFLMGRFEVTQAQWAAVMGKNPSGFADAGCPVENVSWDDCQTFLEKLNALPEAKASGMTFRLPTDEEWEYACRAGATGDNYYRLGDGTDVPFKSLKTVAWVSISWLGGGVDEFNTHRVGRKKPNAFELYDMIGNVWEWTSTEGKRSDTGKTFVVRGGCYDGLNSDGPNKIRMTCSPSEWTKCGLRLCAETAEAREAREEAARAEFEKFITSIVSNMVPIRLLNCRIGKYEVTQALWEAVMGENPSEFKGADNPVENVSWDDCQEFLQKLNALPAVRESGLTFRLPTDEEWEVACRAGSTGNYCLLADGTEITADTLRRVAWYTDNSVERTHRVGQKQTNAFGLYDMLGNVWEWTQTADGEARVLRGGCWCSSARSCEASYRGGDSPSARNDLLGFRLCAETEADRKTREAERAMPSKLDDRRDFRLSTAEEEGDNDPLAAPEPQEIPQENAAEEPPPEEPKKQKIVKRMPADLFEDALFETVNMLRTMPQADACRAAVKSFTDIANKERERSRECYRVITALNSAKNWDDLVAETIFDNPKKREIKVGPTKHVIFPTGTVPGAIVCKRYVKDTVLLDQRIALSDMSPQEKLRILRSEKLDPSPSALFGRALLELVYGSPKTFKAFVDKHKRIEGMKTFYVVYELEKTDLEPDPAAKTDDENEEREAEERARQAEAERQAVAAEEVSRVRAVAEKFRPRVVAFEYDGFIDALQKMEKELSQPESREELRWTMERVQRVKDLRAWIIGDIRKNGLVPRGYQRKFDIQGVTSNGRELLLPPPKPNVPISKLETKDWLGLIRMLIEKRNPERRALNTMERGELYLNAALFCYLHGGDSYNAIALCKRYAQEAITLRTAYAHDTRKLIPILEEELGPGDSASTSVDASGAPIPAEVFKGTDPSKNERQ